MPPNVPTIRAPSRELCSWSRIPCGPSAQYSGPTAKEGPHGAAQAPMRRPNAGPGHGLSGPGHCAVGLEGPGWEPFEDALGGQLGNRVEGPVVSGHIGERLGEGGADQRKHAHCCDGECEMPHFYPPCCCLSRWPRGSSDGVIKFPPAYPIGTVGSVVPPSRSGGRSRPPSPPPHGTAMGLAAGRRQTPVKL